MSNIRVTIVDPTQSSKSLIEVPDDVSLWKLTEAIVESLNLPELQDEKRIQYHLSLRYANGRLIRLMPDRTLSENKVKESDVLQLLIIESEVVPRKKNHLTKDNVEPYENILPVDQNSDHILIYLNVFNPEEKDVIHKHQYFALNIPVWLLLPQLVNKYELPMYDASGNKMAYFLEWASFSNLVEKKRLDYYQTLAEQGVSSGVQLNMISEPIQLTRLKQLLDSKGVGERRLSNQPDALGYFFQQDELKGMLSESANQENSDAQALERIDKTVGLIYQILSQNEVVSENISYLEQRWEDLESKSTYLKNQAISIGIRWLEKVQVNAQFDIYLEISLSLDNLGWMWLSRKDPMNFDIVLYVPENENINKLDILPSFQIIGTNSRHISLPMEPGQQRIMTTYQLMAKKNGQFPIHFDIFQEGRYLNTLIIETQVQAEPINENNGQTKSKVDILRQFPKQGTA